MNRMLCLSSTNLEIGNLDNEPRNREEFGKLSKAEGIRLQIEVDENDGNGLKEDHFPGFEDWK
jgi:hypothetical protein